MYTVDKNERSFNPMVVYAIMRLKDSSFLSKGYIVNAEGQSILDWLNELPFRHKRAALTTFAWSNFQFNSLWLYVVCAQSLFIYAVDVPFPSWAKAWPSRSRNKKLV